MRYLLIIILAYPLALVLGQESTHTYVKKILQEGYTVQSLVQQKLNQQINLSLQAVQKDFNIDPHVWSIVMQAANNKIQAINAKHDFVMATKRNHLVPFFEPDKTIKKQILKAHIPPSCVCIEYDINPSVICDVDFNEKTQSYVLTFNKEIAENLPKNYLRAITHHEATHIRYGDCLKLKFVENLLLCLGHKQEKITSRRSWQHLNYAIEERADQLPVLISSKTAQDMQQFMEEVVFDSSNLYNQKNYTNGQHHPSPFQRLMGVKRVASYLDIEKEIKHRDEYNKSCGALEA
ncbi:MAG: hypothetical protein ACOYT8_05800 [Candidatus Dependentiae bacterium]